MHEYTTRLFWIYAVGFWISMAQLGFKKGTKPSTAILSTFMALGWPLIAAVFVIFVAGWFCGLVPFYFGGWLRERLRKATAP